MTDTPPPPSREVLSEDMAIGAAAVLMLRGLGGTPIHDALLEIGGGRHVVITRETFDTLTRALAEAYERAAQVCDEVEKEAEKEYRHFLSPQEEGRSNGACECAAAIRSLKP